MVFGDDYVPQSLVNYGLDNREMRTDKKLAKKYDIVDIVVSKDNIVIESNGGSKFIDVFGKLEDGTYVNITNDVSCKFDDDSIATWIYGRILAETKGETTITLTYNGVSKKLPIKVQKQIDIEKLVNESMKNNKTMLSLDSSIQSRSSNSRHDAILMGARIVNVKWTPTQSLKAFDGSTFYANQEVKGMPYTQKGTQTNVEDFLYALENKSDFYEGNFYPNYGCDCSGLVSFAWNLDQHTYTGALMQGIYDGDFSIVGSYDKYHPTYNDLYSSYAYVLPGDAVVSTKERHTFLIACTYASDHIVYAYEQTPPKAEYTIWTYDQMANGEYLPFTKY